jgi:hypothetical protein
MRVLLPYTELQSEVTEALDASGFPWEAIDVSDSEEAYFEVLHDMWSFGEAFAVVEHDIVIDPEKSLQGFVECPEPWCACYYPYLRGLYTGLGCVRFSKALVNAVPGLMDEVSIQSSRHHPPKHWCSIDGWMQFRLAAHNYRICRHGPVTNLGETIPSHGCIS